ncbi:hypothetical protein GE061_018240 [Apolygus lucorum]|uniref:Ste24 endopeptidase n=1 Tax=Apolygus lucorum TaxID=248454 RepID=A0A8S9XDG3_APOLU|nr:hypothetical protein GE061_018240 [Apolygus lucorum]
MAVDWRRLMEFDDVSDLWVALIAAMLVVDSWKMYLFMRNIKSVTNMKEVPREMAGLISSQDFQRLRDITTEHSIGDMLDNLFSVGVRIGKLALAYYPYVWSMTSDYAQSLTARTIWFYFLDVFLTRTAFIPLIVLGAILSNNPQSDPFLIFINMAIQSTIHALFAAAGAFGLVYLTDKFGPKGFILLIVVTNVIGFYAVAFYIGSIIPKVSLPLQDTPAGNSVRALAARVGYPQDKIFVDPDNVASPNAYYSCALGSKMIIITQSLIAMLQTEQLTSVVAHELGHWHFHHPTFQYILSILELAGLCFLWKWAYANEFLLKMFSMDENCHPIVPVYLSTYYIWPVIQDVYNGFVSIVGRKCEFLADDYCARQGYAMSLREALLTLAARTKTYPLFDTWYSAWFLGHPTALERDVSVFYETSVEIECVLISEKGKPHVVYKSFKFRRDREVTRGISWRCVEKSCRGRIYTNASSDVVVDDTNAVHDHEIRALTVRQKLSNSLKIKAMDDLFSRPMNLIRKEIVNQAASKEVTTLYQDKESEEGKWMKLVFGMPFLASKDVASCFILDMLPSMPVNSRVFDFAEYLLE